MSARRYIAWMLGTVLTLAMLAIALTVFADPYYLFGTPRIGGLNALKPRVYQQASLAKTTQLERMHPATLLLGNSRIEIGFDPDSSAWPTSAQPVFNAAEAATSPLTAARRLEDADAIAPPRLVIAGVDFPDFFQPPSDRPSSCRCCRRNSGCWSIATAIPMPIAGGRLGATASPRR